MRTSNRRKSSACENLPQLRPGWRYRLPGGGSSSASGTPNLPPGPGWPLLSHWELRDNSSCIQNGNLSMCHCSQLLQHMAFALFRSTDGSC